MLDECKTTKKAFCNWSPSRVHFNFQNGNWLSTVWGGGTYTENHDRMHYKEMGVTIEEFPKKFSRFILDGLWASETVEIAFECGPKLRKKIEKYLDMGTNTVAGYVSMEKWLKVLNWLASEKKYKNLKTNAK